MRLVLRPARPLRFRIVREEDGVPLRVIATVVVRGWLESFYTDDEGRLALEGIPLDAIDTIEVGAYAAGYPSNHWEVPRDVVLREPEVVLRMSRSRARVRVLDSEGRPLASAGAFELGPRSTGKPLAWSDEDGWLRVTVAGADTELLVTANDLAPGVLRLRDLVSGSKVEQPTLTLERGATLAGRVVTRAGTPVEGVEIELRLAPWDASVGAAATDAEGRFAIPHVGAGEHALTARRRFRDEASQILRVAGVRPGGAGTEVAVPGVFDAEITFAGGAAITSVRVLRAPDGTEALHGRWRKPRPAARLLVWEAGPFDLVVTSADGGNARLVGVRLVEGEPTRLVARPD
jgi:hypothetical protein